MVPYACRSHVSYDAVRGNYEVTGLVGTANDSLWFLC